ncbi:cation-transporting ATPase [Streptomyces sp. 3MP-14]|uniref:Cation-transporting ATPase n=1 Tax=Streptomyces mimosae TaxID=2586635 RepID=A0A5N5ZTU3_9ACTN|nr:MULTISPECIES: heavy metal-associated domain-containing protein [Streptomyces]KAB8158378.1 cation-transporting ATPase [Streptomyces mimosae]KAB8172571.1 cation-transporting ATPase [Streptomyces sp. 3MP-14]
MSAEVPAVIEEFRVVGMACRRCARVVDGEVRGLEGVLAVAVDVQADLLTIIGERPVDAAALRERLARHGYRLAPPTETGAVSAGAGAVSAGATRASEGDR